MGQFFPRFFTVFLLLFCLTAKAYKVHIHEKLGSRNSVNVSCILQDSSGLMWFGTTNGLYSYDGSTYRYFGLKEGLADLSISSLNIGKTGKIFVGHHNGKISVISLGNIKPFSLNASLPGNPISQIVEKDAIYISTKGGGLIICDQKQVKVFNHENGLSDDVLYQMLWVDEKTFLTATDGGLLVTQLTKSNPIFKNYAGRDGLVDNILRFIYPINKHEFLVCMQDSGIANFNIQSKKFTSIIKNWSYGPVISVSSEEDGNLLLACENGNLLRLNPNKELVKVEAEQLKTSRIQVLFKDYQRQYWIGTNSGAFLLYNPRLTQEFAPGKLEKIPVTAIGEGAHSTLHYASKNELYDSNGKLICNPSGNNQSAGIISCLVILKNGNIIAGTAADGIYLIDKEGKVKRHLNEGNGLPNNSISALHLNKENQLWIGTLGGGLCRSDAELNSVLSFSENGQLKAAFVLSLYNDNKGCLYIGTDGEGIYQFKNGNFSTPRYCENLKKTTILSISGDWSGIWFTAQESGLFNLKENKLLQYNQKNGLRDNSPLCMSIFQHRIYLFSSTGLETFDTQLKQFTYKPYPENTTEPNLNVSVLTSEGKFICGTPEGLIVYRATETPGDLIRPKALLKELRVNFKPILNFKDSSFQSSQNQFSFYLSCCWFGPEKNLLYRYQLKGIDGQARISDNPNVVYGSLPPGTYSFVFESSASEGEWGKPVVYSFTILKPWWQKPVFWVIGLLIIAGSFYLISQWRIITLRKEKAILEHKVDVRTKELFNQNKIIQDKNKELERLSIVVRETENAVIILDNKGTAEWINESFVKQYGLTFEELKAQRGESIFEISSNSNLPEIFKKCIETGKSQVYESRNPSKTQEIWYSSTMTPIFNHNGEIERVVVIDTDISNRKKNEEIIRQKNKDITDSIEYAKKIQNTILPELSYVNQHLKNFFVLFLQKDIVSGDFYWFRYRNNKVVLAAVDCTGHGVPGAFMSLIGNNLLNHIVQEKGITDPGQILSELNKGVVDALHQQHQQSQTKDGMDAAICCYDPSSKEISFAGAMRPLYIYRKGEFTEIKGNKIPVGTESAEGENISYKTHHMSVEPGDTFYMFTDGYADQFGGEEGKKLKTKNFKKILDSIQHENLNVQGEKLNETYQKWRGSHEQVDDILIIGFRPI